MNAVEKKRRAYIRKGTARPTLSFASSAADKFPTLKDERDFIATSATLKDKENILPTFINVTARIKAEPPIAKNIIKLTAIKFLHEEKSTELPIVMSFLSKGVNAIALIPNPESKAQNFIIKSTRTESIADDTLS